MTDNLGTAVTTVLVANRGEIARRVFATCRRDGHRHGGGLFRRGRTTARTSREADVAVRLPGASPSETYLRGDADRRRRARRRCGCYASRVRIPFRERRVREAGDRAGSTWVGPSPEVDRPDGFEDRVQEDHGRSRGAGASRTRSRPRSPTIDLPVLIKASAGGGGRGMRVVRDARRAARANWPRRSREAGRPSVIRQCSASGIWNTAATSKCRLWPTGTAPYGRSANANARCSVATRKSSKRHRHRWSRRPRACATRCSTRPGARPRRSGTKVPEPSNSLRPVPHGDPKRESSTSSR